MNILPNLGLFGDFAPCEENIIPAINRNFLILDSMTKLLIEDFIIALPEDPQSGQVFIAQDPIGSYPANSLLIWTGSYWINLPAKQGYLGFVKSEEAFYNFDGTDWIEFSGGGGGVVSVADISERDAIETDDRYQGLIVYVRDQQRNYQLQGGITNSDWKLIAMGGILSVANNTARDAIASFDRYEGMLVFVQDTKLTWQLSGGVDNANWVLFGGSGGVISVANNTERDAISTAQRYQGLIVYVRATQQNWQLRGGIDNANFFHLSDNNYFIVADQTARNAIAANVRLHGTLVFQQDTQKFYVLGAGLTNSDWILKDSSLQIASATQVVATANNLITIQNVERQLVKLEHETIGGGMAYFPIPTGVQKELDVMGTSDANPVTINPGNPDPGFSGNVISNGAVYLTNNRIERYIRDGVNWVRVGGF